MNQRRRSSTKIGPVRYIPRSRLSPPSELRGHHSYLLIRQCLDRQLSMVSTYLRWQVRRIWLKALRRRSQNHRMTWAKFERRTDGWLPQARILHPWPSQRFDVRHPRQEPGALAVHAGIWAGGAG